MGRNNGMHERLTVRGSTISSDTVQVNTMIVEYGSTPVSELFPEKKKEADSGSRKINVYHG